MCGLQCAYNLRVKQFLYLCNSKFNLFSSKLHEKNKRKPIIYCYIFLTFLTMKTILKHSVVVWTKNVPIGSYIWTTGLQLVHWLRGYRTFKSYSFAGEYATIMSRRDIWEFQVLPHFMFILSALCMWLKCDQSASCSVHLLQCFPTITIHSCSYSKTKINSYSFLLWYLS